MIQGFQLSPWKKTRIISFSLEMRLLRSGFRYARLGFQEALGLGWGECSVVRLTARGRGSWGGGAVGAWCLCGAGSCGCMVAVQVEGRAEWARWPRVDQGSTPFTMPTFTFIADVLKSANIY